MKYIAFIFTALLCLPGRAQDTLVLLNGQRLAVSIHKITRIDVRYQNWDDIVTSDTGMPVSYIGKVIFSGNRVVEFNGVCPKQYLRLKPESIYGHDYDAAVAKAKALKITGITLIVAGPVTILTGGLILANTIGQGPAWGPPAGWALIGGGAAMAGAGIACVVLNHRYRMQAVKLKNGRAMLNLPQPDVLMAATPNRLSFGLGIKAGLQF